MHEPSRTSAPESTDQRSTLAQMMRDVWLQGLPLVFSAGGLAALVVGVGGAVEVARFYGAGLPAYQAVDAAAQGELNVVGLTWLVTFGVLGILAVFLVYLASPTGKATPAMHYALIGIAAAEAGAVWWLGRREGFWEQWELNLVALLFVVGPAAGAVAIVARRHRAARNGASLVGGPLRHKVLPVKHKRSEDSLALRHIDFAGLALLSVVAGAGTGLSLGHVWVGLTIPFAGALGLVALRMADLSGERFRWYGVCVFFSVALFGAVLSVLRAIDEPRLQPVAFILEQGERAVAVEGVYVGESDSRLWFASVALGDCDELHVRPGSGRLWSVPRDQVTHLSVGPPVGLPKLAHEASSMLAELRAVRPGREVTAYPRAVRDSVAIERLGNDERGSPGTWVRAGSKEDLGDHPRLRIGRTRLPLRLRGREWQLQVPDTGSSGPIHAACGERTNRAWLTVLKPPRAVPTATPLGGGNWRLDASRSRDRDGSIRRYRWMIRGQDPARNLKMDVELPSGRRTMSATLRVTDDDGLADDRDVRLKSGSSDLGTDRLDEVMRSMAPLFDVRRLAEVNRADRTTGPSGVVAASVPGTRGLLRP